ncbi:MAG: PaaI family thioesterase [Acidimicrobiia bacterium]|nr:PaaI family thioesterase [Acidimicrobiia bacterium]
MTGDPSARRELAAALADEVRGIIETLTVADTPLDALATATGLARDLRAVLGGPRRLRWYEAGGPRPDSEARDAFLDQSPLRGALNPLAPPLELDYVERPDGTRAVVGRARLGPAYEGPPHGVHGGYVAALFDELLGATQAIGGSVGVTARLTIRYRHVTPVDEDLRFEGWVEDQHGRRIVAHATCHAGDTLTAEAEALFLSVDFEEVEARMMERRAANPDE